MGNKSQIGFNVFLAMNLFILMAMATNVSEDCEEKYIMKTGQVEESDNTRRIFIFDCEPDKVYEIEKRKCVSPFDMHSNVLSS